jgi:hypothetical protein
MGPFGWLEKKPLPNVGVPPGEIQLLEGGLLIIKRLCYQPTAVQLARVGRVAPKQFEAARWRFL